jgi:pyruvate kinase
MMDRIIRQVEQDNHYLDVIETTRVEATATASDAITAAAGAVAHTISAAAIVTYTTSGSTALRAARQRPSVPIMCLTNQRSTARRMTVVWGLYPVVTGDVRNFTEMVARAARIAVRERFARKGQQLVVTAGVPFGTPGATNVLRIFTVNE